LSALKELISRLNPEKVKVIIQNNTSNIPKDSLRELCSKNNRIELFSIDSQIPKRYLHAKLIIAKDKAYDYALFGSANMSKPALFGRNEKGNYEISVFGRFPLNQIEKTLNINEMITPIKIDDIKITEELSPIEVKEKKTGIKILTAEFSKGKYKIVIIGDNIDPNIKIELLLSHDSILECEAEKSGENSFSINGTFIPDAKLIRLASIEGRKHNWIPIIYFEKISELERKKSKTFERLKNNLLSSTGNDEQSYYFNKIIDFLVDRAISKFDRKPIKVFKKVDGEQDKKASEKEYEVSIEEQIIEGDRMSSGEISFEDGVRELFSFFLRNENTHIDEDDDIKEEDEDINDDENIQEESTKVDSGEIIRMLDIERLASKMRNQRRKYLNSRSLEDFFFNLCFFSIIALPHFENLHKYYFVEKKSTRISVVDNKEWEGFIVESILKIGLNIFPIQESEFCIPEVNIPVEYHDTYFATACVFLYSIATIFPWLKRKSKTLGDENLHYIIYYNRAIILSVLIVDLLKNRENINLIDISDEVKRLHNVFKCRWIHIENSIEEFLNIVFGLIENQLANNKIPELGNVYWKSNIGFCFLHRGIEYKLWEKK